MTEQPPIAEKDAPRHMPCDMGCQPDWHHDDCAIYLPDEALCPGCGMFHPTATLGGRWGMCPPCDESTRPPGGSDA